jgi:hypothetical protein
MNAYSASIARRFGAGRRRNATGKLLLALRVTERQARIEDRRAASGD